MEEKIGVFVDDFAILHKGHELCIKYALSKVDKLIVVIYESKRVTIPMQIRQNWLRALYPDLEVHEAWFDLEDTKERIDEKAQFIMKILNGRKIERFFGDNEGLEPLCQTLDVENALKPHIQKRNRIISERIEKDNYEYKAYMDPKVYRDLIINVAFVGAQSTGKSTIAEALAKKYNTNYMFEYGRYHWDVYEQNRIETLNQIAEIGQRHIQMEEERLKSARKYLFTDTCPIVLRRYAYDWHGKANEELEELANEAEKRYDLFFVCGNDIPYANTPERDGEEQRDRFQRQIVAELLSRKIPYIYLEGSLDKRIQRVSNVLEHYQKYTSIGRDFGKIEEKGKER